MVEKVGVLLVCAVLLVGLVKLDSRGYQRHAEAARAALAHSDPEKAQGPAPAGRPRTTLALSWLVLLSAGGLVLAGAGARMVLRR